MISICGEADHPLLPQFKEYYSKIFDQVIIQMGVVDKWFEKNGDTSNSGLRFVEKVDQQNAALAQVDSDTEYVFYFDIDEFLPYEELYHVYQILNEERPDVISFQLYNFWKTDGYYGVGGDGWGYDAWARRIFRYEHGMVYTSHRPPTLFTPVNKDLMQVQPYHYTRGRILHYSYVYEEQVKRKLLYYNMVYPQFNYMEWFNMVWRMWKPENRKTIEAIRSVHPSMRGATTELYTGQHPIIWQSSQL